jgi:hypothetical protein
MYRIYLLFILAGASLFASAQERVGNRWIDNNLVFKVQKDEIKEKGTFMFCILDTTKEACIENLSTGVEVTIYNAEDKEIWTGIASGKTKELQLPRALPTGRYLIIKAFKPWVTNRFTGNRIYQDKAIETKHYIK